MRLANSSDVLGYAMDTGANDIGVFYRNGSFGADTAQGDLNSVVDFTVGLRKYGLPAGFNYQDIVGFAWDDDASGIIYAFFRNGSVLNSSVVANLGSDFNFTTNVSTWSIPSGFNVSDIIDFEIDSAEGVSAVFMHNGSFINATTEAPPFNFDTAGAFTIPSDFPSYDMIGVAYDRSADDLAMFFRNRSYVSDINRVGFGGAINFNAVWDATYNAGVNLTTFTNITLQTRISNNSVTFTSWSSIYVNPNGSQSVESANGRYIQYKAVFYSPDKYKTPYLQNVSINYTIDIIVPAVNSSINNTSPRFREDINFTANTSDISGVNFCQFIDNMSTDGSKRFFNISLSGQNAQCSQNYTIFVPKKSVINFSLIVNDTYNNKNQTDFIITVADWRANVTNLTIQSVIDLNPGNQTTVTCNATISDNDNVSDIKAVNATFYHISVGVNSANDNNNHYTNNSCLALKNATFESNYTCGFSIQYYANNGTWRCNITSVDMDDRSVFGNVSSLINELMAIDVSPLIIDYGALKVTNTSNDTSVTIRNFGNIPINISLRGFAPDEERGYLNLSMICENGRNISNSNQKFSTLNGTDFTGMIPMNNETQLINFTLQQRTNDITFGNDTNSTFWKIQIPAATLGFCNGTIIFGAISIK